MWFVIVSSIIGRTVRTMMDSHATEALLLENEVANMTLDSIEEAVLRTNTDGNITYLNRMAEEMTGWNREEALGRPMAEVIRIVERASAAAITEIVGAAAQKDKTAKEVASCSNCVLIRRDGFEFGIEIKATPIRNHDGLVTGVHYGISRRERLPGQIDRDVTLSATRCADRFAKPGAI